MTEKTLTVTLARSAIGATQRQKGTLRALGLKHLGDVIEVQDSDVVRGMLRKVEHLLEVSEE